MTHAHRVPFSQCRVGTQINFEVFPGRPTLGVVEALVPAGPRNFLVALSKTIDHDGTVHIGPKRHTGRQMVNLAHATHVLEHSQGSLVFDQDDYNAQEQAKRISQWRRDGTFRRRGKHLVIDLSYESYDYLSHVFLRAYVMERQHALRVQPWELVDYRAMRDALHKVGIINVPLAGVWRAEAITVNMTRMKAFVHQNLNRFKANLKKAERAADELQRQLDEEEYRRDVEREACYG